MAVPLERAGHALYFEALDDVALLDVLIVGERHAALVTLADFLDVIFEALELRQVAFVDDDVIAQQPDFAAALDDAFGDHAARHFADLRDVEDLADVGVTDEALLERRREHAGEEQLHVVRHFVNDRVVADVDAVTFGDFTR